MWAPNTRGNMFTVETEFDHTVVTVMDKTGEREDLIVVLREEGVFLKQYDEYAGRTLTISLSEKQVSDLFLALNSSDGTFISE